MPVAEADDRSGLDLGGRGMSDGESPPSPEELARLEAAPELYRGRARAVAGLVATGAGAVAAGITFGAPTTALPKPVQWVAVASLVLLLLSVVSYVAASQHAQDKDLPDATAYVATHRDIVKKIRCRITAGSVFGLMGLLALALTATLAVSLPTETVAAEITLRKKAWDDARSVCPALEQTFSGHVSRSALAGTSELILLRANAGECEQDTARALEVPRAGLAAILYTDD